MPVVPENYTRRPLGGDPIHEERHRLPTGFLPKAYFVADDNGDRFAWQGLVVAEVEGGVAAGLMASQKYYVPYSAAGSYGTGSDTAVGIMAEFHDETLTSWQIAPVDVGTAYEARCYEGGGPLGTVSATAKTDLSDIKWR